MGLYTKTPVCVRSGGGDRRGADVPEETRPAESWERVIRCFSFPFVFFLSVCVGQ